MMEDRKTWMIEAGDVLEIRTPDPEPEEIRRPTLVSHMKPKRETATAKVKRAKQPSTGMHFARSLTMTYLLGPLSILVPRRPACGRGWLLTGFLSAAAAGLLIRWQLSPTDSVPAWAWIVVAALATLAGPVVWARAVWLLGQQARPATNRWPLNLRAPWVRAVASLVAPGSGFLLTGRADLAAVVILAAGPIIFAGLLVQQSGRLWGLQRAAEVPLIHAVTLEKIFLTAGLMLVLGLFGWMAQSLEAMRREPKNSGVHRKGHGDRFALALVGALACLVVLGQPARVARHAAEYAEALQVQDFKYIPYQLNRMAVRLDPSKSEYRVRVIALGEALGYTEDATRLRQELDADVSAYMATMGGATAKPRFTDWMDYATASDARSASVPVGTEAFPGLLVLPKGQPTED